MTRMLWGLLLASLASAGCCSTCGLCNHGCGNGCCDGSAGCDGSYRPPGPWFLRCGCSDCSAGCDGSYRPPGPWFLRCCGPNCYDPGCDSCNTRSHARLDAELALRNYGKQCGKSHSCHFREGFEQAYVDIAEGGNGTTPAVPPQRYWSRKYRTAAGHARAEEWFEGYRAGVAMAEGNSQYNRIPLSVSTVSYQGDSQGWQQPGTGVIEK